MDILQNSKGVLYAACRVNDVETVEYILFNSKVEYPVIDHIHTSTQFKDIKILSLLCQNFPSELINDITNVDDVLGNCMYQNNVAAFNFIIQKFGIYNVNKLLKTAIYCDNIDIVYILVQTYKATDFNRGLLEAIEHRHYMCAKYMIECGANNFDRLTIYNVYYLLDIGCYTHLKDLEFTKRFKAVRDKKQEESKRVIDDLNLSNYDVNITNIITEYMPYEWF